MKLLASVAGILLLAGADAVACPSPLTGKDASGTTQNFGVTLDASNNCYGNVAIVDGSAAANKATVSAAGALKVDGSAVTQPVSGTVTANQGSPPWSVSQSGTWTDRVVGNAGGIFDFAGQNAAQPANSILIGGEFNTTPTTLTSGNASPLQLDSAGNLLVNIKANSFGTITVTGTVTANQGTSPWTENVSQFGGSNVVTGTGASGAGIPRVTVSNDSNILATQSGSWNVGQSGTWTVQQGSPPWTVQGDSASGASNAGNPVKAGGVFNTTQPTVTTGQTVDAQSTARGALIVATGVDAFTVGGTVTANQGGAPWSDNLTQIAGSSVSTAASGILKVGITGSTGAALDAAGQNASSPANELLTACQFNTSPTTVISGNITPVQCNNAGALNVAIVSGGGSGGTASSFGAAFPATGTAIGVKNGSNMVNLAADGSSNLLVNCAVGCGASGFADLGAFTLGTSNINPIGGVYETSPAPVSAGQAAAVMITGNRAAFVNHRDSSGQELGASLPGQANVPVRTTLAPVLTAPPPLLPAQALWDGTHYAAVAAPNIAPTAAQGALVVAMSPNSTATVSGTVTANAGSGTFTVGGTVTAAQSTAANLNATVVGTGTFAVQAAQSGTWTVQQGTPPWTVNPGTAANWGIGATGSSVPANAVLVGMSQGGNTTALTGTSGNLNVNLAASAATVTVSGTVTATGITQQDLTAFTFGTTSMVPIGGVYSTTPSPIASGQAAAARLTANRAVQENHVNSAGQELGANLPGANNVPVQVNQVVTLTPPPNTLQSRINQTTVLNLISDGQHFASVNPGLRAPAVTDSSVVVAVSPLPSLQCPYTVGINQTASTQIVTGQTGKRLHVCTFGFVSASAQNVSLVEGTGSTCGTGTAALVGGTSASVAAAANGGLWNTSAQITIPMQNNGDNLCVLQSASGNVSGTLTYGVF